MYFTKVVKLVHPVALVEWIRLPLINDKKLRHKQFANRSYKSPNLFKTKIRQLKC